MNLSPVDHYLLPWELDKITVPSKPWVKAELTFLVALSKFKTRMLSSTFSIDCFDFPQSVLVPNFVSLAVFRLLCGAPSVFVFCNLLTMRNIFLCEQRKAG